MNLLQLVAIQSWASFAVCAGAPSYWKMKPDGKTDKLVSKSEYLQTAPNSLNSHNGAGRTVPSHQSATKKLPSATVSQLTFSGRLARSRSAVTCLQLLSCMARWRRCTVSRCYLEQVPIKGFNIKFSIHFGHVWNEMQSSLPTETNACRNHDVLDELCSFSHQPMFIDFF